MNFKSIIGDVALWFANFWIDNSVLLDGGIIQGTDANIYLSKNTNVQNIFLLESKYKTMTRDNLQKLLNVNWARFVPYHLDNFDCDAYALELQGALRIIAPDCSIFTAYTIGRHAFNIAILSDGSCVWIEPQTNKIYNIDDVRNNLNYFPPSMVIG